MPLLIQHALGENPSCSSMTDVHSDSDCIPLVMESAVSLRDLIQWLTTLFTRRFSSLWTEICLTETTSLVWFLPFGNTEQVWFFHSKIISKILLQLFRYSDLAFLNILPLIFYLMDKQLLFFLIHFQWEVIYQTPYHPGHIQLTAIIYWMTHVLCWYDPRCCAVLIWHVLCCA